MIGFDHPEAWILGALVALVVGRRLVRGRTVTALRVALLLAVTALIAGPHVSTTAKGRDLVFVVDRSRSMPAAFAGRMEELLSAAAGRAGEGDRVGIVAFGRGAVVERPPEERFAPAPFRKAVDGAASDLAAALETAAALVPPERPATLLVVSDGESTGRDPRPAARHARRRGMQVDAVVARRDALPDVAVDEVGVPASVRAGDPFLASVWIRAESDVEAPVRVWRGDTLLAEGTRGLRRGRNRIRIADRIDAGGVHEYRVEVAAPADRVPENDRAVAAVRASGRTRVLCVTPEGREDRLSGSLRAAGIHVETVAPGSAPATLPALAGYRAVVLEDVALSDLPSGSSAALARWVRELGGGLLVTGGRASFGLGGYHESEVGETLPVTMEMRDEQRRFHLAMAIVLDRSGSMAMAAGDGTKMDLANRGAIAAIELLSRSDSVAVVAVDSAPHVVVPLSPATDRGALAAEVATIEAGGGGIFVGVGLHAGAEELAKAKQGARHLVLFADAADAEEPTDYRTFVPDLVRAGVTVSVIGLGSDTDVDAELLREIARLGKGRMFFTQDAAALPRLFAQDTIQAAKSSFIDVPTPVGALPERVALGALPASFPSIGGYSIGWLRPRAQAAYRTGDEQGAPLLSFWNHGVGRTAAFLGVADGPSSGGLATWDGYAELFATVVRWTSGSEAADVHVEVRREGHEGVVAVEVEPQAEASLAGVRVQVAAPGGASIEVPLERLDATRLEGRFALEEQGVHLPVVRLGDGRFLRAAPLVLPYSPEHEPRLDPAAGERTLAALVEAGGGRVDPPLAGLWEGRPGGRATKDLTPLFAGLALLLLLCEIAVRRFGVPSAVPRAARATTRLARRLVPRRRARPTAAAPAPSPAVVSPAPEPAATSGPAAVGPASPPPRAPKAPPPGPAPGPGGIADLLDRERRRRR